MLKITEGLTCWPVNLSKSFSHQLISFLRQIRYDTVNLETTFRNIYRGDTAREYILFIHFQTLMVMRLTDFPLSRSLFLLK